MAALAKKAEAERAFVGGAVEARPERDFPSRRKRQPGERSLPAAGREESGKNGTERKNEASRGRPGRKKRKDREAGPGDYRGIGVCANIVEARVARKVVWFGVGKKKAAPHKRFPIDAPKRTAPRCVNDRGEGRKEQGVPRSARGRRGK